MVEMMAPLGKVVLDNPVLTASGCAAAGQELNQFFDVSKLGAVVTKSIMTQPRSGRATPRMAETPSGMLNSIGLQGPGIDAFLKNDLAWLAKNRVRTVVSIAGGHTDEYVELARRLQRQSGGRDDRGQHLVPERREPRAGVRLRRDRIVPGDLGRAPGASTPRCRSSPSSRRTSPTSP